MSQRSKSCARCGASFGCGAEAPGGCWCAQLPPVLPLSAGNDCLCPDCLRAALTASVGDCLDCRHAETLKTKGGGAVLLCRKAALDTALPKYPRLPRTSCGGREPR